MAGSPPGAGERARCQCDAGCGGRRGVSLPRRLCRCTRPKRGRRLPAQIWRTRTHAVSQQPGQRRREHPSAAQQLAAPVAGQLAIASLRLTSRLGRSCSTCSKQAKATPRGHGKERAKPQLCSLIALSLAVTPYPLAPVDTANLMSLILRGRFQSLSCAAAGGGRESKPPRSKCRARRQHGEPLPAFLRAQPHPAGPHSVQPPGRSRQDPISTPLMFSTRRGLRPAPQPLPTHHHPLGPLMAPSTGHLPGVGSRAWGPVRGSGYNQQTQQQSPRVSSSSRDPPTHTRRLLVLSVCAVSVCQSGDRICPEPHTKSAAKPRRELGRPGAAPA